MTTEHRQENEDMGQRGSGTSKGIEFRLSVDADSLALQRIWEAQGRTRISEELRRSLDSLCRS